VSFLLVIIVSVLTCMGQLFQKQAVEHWRLYPMGWQGKLLTGWLWAAVACLGLGMLVWLLVLQQLDVSIAYPMLSLNFVLVTLASQIWFNEPTDLRHWAGIVLIIVGIVLLRGT